MIEFNIITMDKKFCLDNAANIISALSKAFQDVDIKLQTKQQRKY